jgi:hypothetical protein
VEREDREEMEGKEGKEDTSKPPRGMIGMEVPEEKREENGKEESDDRVENEEKEVDEYTTRPPPDMVLMEGQEFSPGYCSTKECRRHYLAREAAGHWDKDYKGQTSVIWDAFWQRWLCHDHYQDIAPAGLREQFGNRQ